MKQRTKTEIIDFFSTLVGEKIKDEEGVEVNIKKDGTIEIELYRMYDFFKINFSTLKAISDFFETENIDVDQQSSSGCETCDYGSKYTHTFYIK